jgi:hypothetical protein
MNLENMNKVIEFLRTLEESKFNFRAVVSSQTVDENSHICGSVCCAVGWFPKIFPDTVYWGSTCTEAAYNTHVSTRHTTGYQRVAAEVLDISDHHAVALFTPVSPGEDLYGFLRKAQATLGLQHLDEHASPMQVARNLEHYKNEQLRG